MGFSSFSYTNPHGRPSNQKKGESLEARQIGSALSRPINGARTWPDRLFVPHSLFTSRSDIALRATQMMAPQKRCAAEAESLLVGVKAIIFDIEGTTTPISFVKVRFFLCICNQEGKICLGWRMALSARLHDEHSLL